MDYLEISRKIIDSLEEKKGEDLTLIDLKNVASFTDYFILCTGSSNRMLRSLADSALETAKKTFDLTGKVEGSPDLGWILVDLGDVIIHFFSPEQRDFYQLESLWHEGKVLLRLH